MTLPGKVVNRFKCGIKIGTHFQINQQALRISITKCLGVASIVNLLDQILSVKYFNKNNMKQKISFDYRSWGAMLT